MPHYLLSVCYHEDYADESLDDPDVVRSLQQVSALNEEMRTAGIWVFAGGLESATVSATVVRATDTGVSMTDGPYAETKEQMAGFWVIEAPDFDVALDWAGRATAACERPIEVRPFQGIA